MSTHPDAPRIIQSNDVAAIITQQAAEHAPDLFVILGLRYGIADALWAAGYREDAKVVAQLQATQAEAEKWHNLYLEMMEQSNEYADRASAAEGTITEALSYFGVNETAYVVKVLRRADTTALAEHDKHVAAQAIKDWADLQEQALTNFSYVVDDADEAETKAWCQAARHYADALERADGGHE